MKKSSSRKTKSTKPKSHSTEYIRYIFVVSVLIALVLTGKVLFYALTNTDVLGTHTQPTLIADHGSDDSGSSGGSSSGSGSSSSGDSSNSSSSSSSGPNGSNSSSGSNSNSSNNPTPTQTTQNTDASHQSIETPQAHLEAQTEGNKGELNLETADTHIEIKQEDNGEIHATAKSEDGSQHDLDQNEALEKINDELKDSDIEISTSSSQRILIKKGNTEAETDLPISVDSTTKALTVTTPAGTKTVAILPDQAVENLLGNKILTEVESQISTTSGVITQKVLLTDLNNEPVFQVNGISQKRVLGIFPLGFNKTAFVSASTGQVVKIDESTFSKFLESISF